MHPTLKLENFNKWEILKTDVLQFTFYFWIKSI